VKENKHMKRVLSIAAAALLVSSLPALAQTTVEGEASGSGSTVIQPGGTVSGDADATITGSIDLSAEQQTELRTVLMQDVRPVEGEFEISVGSSAPDTIELLPLPPRFVEVVPQYEGYRYFVLADGRIVIVQPDTLEVVYIMEG
jgi:hypothetical protein